MFPKPLLFESLHVRKQNTPTLKGESILVRAEGFEPTTSSTSMMRSSQVSYARSICEEKIPCPLKKIKGFMVRSISIMKTSHKILIGLLLLLASAGSIGGFLYTREIAEAYDLADIVIEPAEKNPRPEVIIEPEDPRVKGLSVRGDGARLVSSVLQDETFLRLAFIDNSTLIVSATSTEEGAEMQRVFTLSLEGGRATVVESEKYVSASSHRPSHMNAGTTCFSYEDNDGMVDIWCRKRGDARAVHLTEHDGSEALTEPAISPGGDWVSFQVEDVSNNPEGSTIWKIGMNRSGIQQLTRGADDRYPTWSGDAKTIYFQRRSSRSESGTWDVYRMTAAGANPEPILRTHYENEMWPTEAGQGRIIFSTGPVGEDLRLRLLDIETKSGTWLTSGEYGSETHPSISPDGKLVSFIAPVDLEYPDILGIWIVEIK